MGALCKVLGADVYAGCKDKILSGIRDNLERKPVSELDEATQKEAAILSEKLSKDQSNEEENYEVKELAA